MRKSYRKAFYEPKAFIAILLLLLLLFLRPFVSVSILEIVIFQICKRFQSNSDRNCLRFCCDNFEQVYCSSVNIYLFKFNNKTLEKDVKYV